MKRPFVTAQEASEYLRIGRSTIYRAIETGELPAYKIGHYRIRWSDLETWLETYKVKKAPTKRRRTSQPDSPVIDFSDLLPTKGEVR
jgi:excisionase family DNA binding protein